MGLRGPALESNTNSTRNNGEIPPETPTDNGEVTPPVIGPELRGLRDDLTHVAVGRLRRQTAQLYRVLVRLRHLAAQSAVSDGKVLTYVINGKTEHR